MGIFFFAQDNRESTHTHTRIVEPFDIAHLTLEYHVCVESKWSYIDDMDLSCCFFLFLLFFQ